MLLPKSYFWYFGAFLLIFPYHICFAQKSKTISGVVLDNIDRKFPLEYATVSIYTTHDTSLVAYRLSGPNGQFRVSVSSVDTTFLLVVTAWQYEPFRKTVKYVAGQTDLSIDSIFLTKSNNTLEEVTILAQRPPIVVKKDTIEFNAESFKTLPTAVVEDLLRKLPGVMVAPDGAITFNGKVVDKILVDGKDFFEGDIQIASKNLPAGIVDKVQVTDDKDFIARNPHASALTVPKVINLTLKKGVKQGGFGKVYAGMGTRERFEFGGIFNLFRDTTQISLLGYANNVNKPGFGIQDIRTIGGFDRSGYNSLSGSQGGYKIDNIGFGGTETGVQKSTGGGINLNHVTKSGVKFNTRYFYGRNNAVLEQLQSDNQSLLTGRIITRTASEANNIINSHTISSKITWKPDPKTDVELSPLYSSIPRRYKHTLNKSSFDERLNPLSLSEIANIQGGTENILRLRASLWHKFKAPGHTFFAGLDISDNHRKENLFNNSFTQLFAGSGTDIVDQLRINGQNSFSTSLNTTYSRQLTKAMTLSLNFTGSYISSNNGIQTLHPDIRHNYIIPDALLSGEINQNGIKTTTSFKSIFTLGKSLQVQPSLVFGSINLRNAFSQSSDLNQNYYFLLPGINLGYKNLIFDYTPSFIEPGIRDIQPIPNNTDPLFIQNGNRSLKPTRANQVYLSLFKFNMPKSLNYNLSVNGRIARNGVIYARSVDGNGAQTITPVNQRSSYLISSSALINKSWISPKRQISLNTAAFLTIGRNEILLNNQWIDLNSVLYGHQAGLRFNLNNRLEVVQNINLQYGTTAYGSDTFKATEYISPSAETEIVLRYIKNLVFETDYTIQHTNQNVSGVKNTFHILNAGVIFEFMENKRALLKLSVADIFDFTKQRSTSITENIVRDIQRNNIGRYFLLTLTYNIQNYNKKIGGKERLLGF